ncbi:AP-1 complex subunit gamma-2-like [Camellia sinensis]|uniref:AP-1 complex subunit gamma-2-like n=1 Tax=Camellia sinensis TaxID=4442 RepID=UPI00103556B7|nr:AP-1 complex subunit gamma-2-like [Camellia sinensis]
MISIDIQYGVLALNLCIPLDCGAFLLSSLCLYIFQDSDASIRKRALELVYLLVNESNVKSLTKELIEYLEVSVQDFKGDLTAKICSIVEKFSTEKIWYIDQMLKVLSEMVFDVQMWI